MKCETCGKPCSNGMICDDCLEGLRRRSAVMQVTYARRIAINQIGKGV